MLRNGQGPRHGSLHPARCCCEGTCLPPAASLSAPHPDQTPGRAAHCCVRAEGVPRGAVAASQTVVLSQCQIRSRYRSCWFCSFGRLPSPACVGKVCVRTWGAASARGLCPGIANLSAPGKSSCFLGSGSCGGFITPQRNQPIEHRSCFQGNGFLASNQVEFFIAIISDDSMVSCGYSATLLHCYISISLS